MRVMNIALMVLRVAVLLALILGIIFWANPAVPAENETLKGVHMLLGIIAVLSLWVVSVAQSRVKGGSFALALVGIIVGLVVLAVGLSQDTLKAGAATGTVELINTIHLLLGLLTIGTGEMISRSSKRRARA